MMSAVAFCQADDPISVQENARGQSLEAAARYSGLGVSRNDRESHAVQGNGMMFRRNAMSAPRPRPTVDHIIFGVHFEQQGVGPRHSAGEVRRLKPRLR